MPDPRDVLPLTHASAAGEVSDVPSLNTVGTLVERVVGPFASSDGDGCVPAPVYPAIIIMARP